MRKLKTCHLLILYLQYCLLADLLKEDEKMCKPSLNGSLREPFETTCSKNSGFPHVFSQPLALYVIAPYEY